MDSWWTQVISDRAWREHLNVPQRSFFHLLSANSASSASALTTIISSLAECSEQQIKLFPEEQIDNYSQNRSIDSPLDSQTWLVLQKWSITGRRGSQPRSITVHFAELKNPVWEKGNFYSKVSASHFYRMFLTSSLWSMYFTSQNYKIQIHSAYKFQNRIENKEFIFRASRSSRKTSAKIDLWFTKCSACENLIIAPKCWMMCL